jgi:hypothetical protein
LEAPTSGPTPEQPPTAIQGNRGGGGRGRGQKNPPAINQGGGEKGDVAGGRSGGGGKATSTKKPSAEPPERGPTIARFGKEEVALLVKYWQGKLKATNDPNLKRTYQKRIKMLQTRGRSDPKNWKMTEEEMAHIYGQIGGKGETAYLNKKEISPGEAIGTPGVTKPDLVGPNVVGEVKTWNVSYPKDPAHAQKLLNDLAGQINDRRDLGTKQTVILDVRGQKLSEAQLRVIGKTLADKTGLPIEHIQIVVWDQKKK